MAQALVLYFDPLTENRILQLEDALHRMGLEPFPAELPARPHIRLAGFDQPLSSVLLARMEVCARDLPSLDVHLLAMGFFPTREGGMYLAPNVTREMLIMHAAFHRLNVREGAVSHEQDLPGRWFPHCDIAAGLPLSHIPSAVEACRAIEVFVHGKLSTLAVVDYPDLHEVLSVPLSD